MKRMLVTATILAAALAGFAPAAQAQQGNNCQGPNCMPPGQQQQGQKQHGNQAGPGQSHGNQPGQAQRMDSAQNAPAKHIDDRPGENGGVQHAPGHAPSAAQLRHLPPPPHGREYRVVNDRVVLIDSDTLATVAVIGLLSALLHN